MRAYASIYVIHVRVYCIEMYTYKYCSAIQNVIGERIEKTRKNYRLANVKRVYKYGALNFKVIGVCVCNVIITDV